MATTQLSLSKVRDAIALAICCPYASSSISSSTTSTCTLCMPAPLSRLTMSSWIRAMNSVCAA
eukprot:scaffold3631_cov264-Prasinococcus_capsulatus_cf.AAC.3